jgi:hypothetical protein
VRFYRQIIEKCAVMTVQIFQIEFILNPPYQAMPAGNGNITNGQITFHASTQRERFPVFYVQINDFGFRQPSQDKQFGIHAFLVFRGEIYERTDYITFDSENYQE